jgi:tetratricopeptide (TPR) repeat protein
MSRKLETHQLIQSFKRNWILAGLIFTATLITYQPAWNGQPIWDDDGHITKPELRSFEGLIKIWTVPGATQQYYPLVHSAFWIAYHIWGGLPFGYHILNILLHVFSALLLVKILKYLHMPDPAAWFSGAVFALHPIQVESVAWIMELKNTLSGVFFLSTALVYLKFDQQRKKSSYVGAIILFILGLLSKSVIATLPVSLLAIFWWKRGKISFKKDITPLVPFFIIGIVSGLFTAWVENAFIIDADFNKYNFSIVERCLIAGRAFWFYLSKIFWPANLIFIYPRWNVSQAIWWQYLFPVATFLLAGVLWIIRDRWRAPLAVLVCFFATIFPVMGFFNIYPFRYSFVADHFQYLACIGPIVLAVTGCSRPLAYIGPGKRFLKSTAIVFPLLVFGFLSWKQCYMYTDAETLYRTIISKNPDCLMAYNNLSSLLVKSGRNDEAFIHYQKALDIDSNSVETHNGLGVLLAKTNRADEAIARFRRALEINPNHVGSHYNLGTVLLQIGRTDDAIVQYRKALDIDPNSAEAQINFGILLAKNNRAEEAIAHFRKAAGIDPKSIDAQNSLGNSLFLTGHMEEAIVHYRKALEINPDYSEANYNLGNALFQAGQFKEAVPYFRKAREICSNTIPSLKNTAIDFLRNGKPSDALPLLTKALVLATALDDQTQKTEIEMAINFLKQKDQNK